MSERIPVYVFASDPLSQAGIASQLRSRPELHVVDDADFDVARVALLVVDVLDEEAVRVVTAMQRNGCPRVVMVVNHLDDSGLLAAVGAGICGLVRRGDAVPEHLVATVVAADSGDGTVPADLLGRLLHQVGQLHRNLLAPRGFTLSGMSEREIAVLRLVADGLDTADVANELYFSERTVKNVIHDVTTRLNLKNRTHAVAYALRQGLI